jgi:putative phage-type endonuclease
MAECYLRLLNRPSYAQRTPEWHAIRETLITASDAAAALEIPPYPSFSKCPREELMKKKLGISPSTYSGFMNHGVAYEDEARQKYMDMTGEVVHEFGLLIHPDLPWLGASPDGITESGKLVEIKCPVKRTVEPGHVPEHYMPQLQVCMEVCDLESCVFIQYKPESLTWPNPGVFDIVEVPRDRAWFEDRKGPLQRFWEEMMERKNNVKGAECVPVTPKPSKEVRKAVCDIQDALYEMS